MVSLAPVIKTIESRLSRRSRNTRLALSFVVVAVLVLGPLSLAAWACNFGGGWGHGGGSEVATPAEPVDDSADPAPTEPEPPAEPAGDDVAPSGDSGGNDVPAGDGNPEPAEDASGSADEPTESGEPAVVAAAPAPAPAAAAPTPEPPAANPAPAAKETAPAKRPKKQASEKPREKKQPAPVAAGGSLLAAANLPIAASAQGEDGAGSNSKEKSGKPGTGGSSGRGSGEATDRVRDRTTIARAVDGIPLGFRIALLALLFSTAVLLVVSWRERRRAENVARVALLDHLTGLANREGFDRQMATEWSRAARYGRPLGLVFVDLDDFKAYNDSNGHLAGDRLLREVSAAITKTARGSDFTARLGGDEFVVLCPETSAEGLEKLVQRLRVEASGMAVTLAIGAAQQQPDDESPDELLERADEAMYRAKGGGRRNATSSANPMLGSIRRGAAK